MVNNKKPCAKKFGIILFIFQIAFVLIIGFLGKYDKEADAKYYGKISNESDVKENHVNSVKQTYPMFQDVQGMMFLGFGFLMTFLKRYGYSAVGLNFMLCAVVLQWATIIHGVSHLKEGYINIDVGVMLSAEFTLAAILISYGAVLGKCSPLQLLILAMIEVPLMLGNEYLGRSILLAVDIGDSIFVHTFGAYFGLAVALVLTNKSVERASKKKEGAVYHSDHFAMIGTLILWIFWPSFNASTAPGEDQHRAVINTFYALTASTVMTFAISCLTSEEGKLDMVHVQNATLAGGVAIGASADLVVYPGGAIAIGCIAGIVSTVGYKFLTPKLNARGLHDTCGVNNLHGMPGIIGGICSAIVTCFVTHATYGNSMYVIYTGMQPYSNDTQVFLNRDQILTVDAHAGKGRSAHQQAGYQMLALGITLAIAIVGGLLTGLLLKIKFWNNLTEDEYFDDERFWEVPTDFALHGSHNDVNNENPQFLLKKVNQGEKDEDE